MLRWNQKYEQLKKDEPFFNAIANGDLNKIKQMVENEGANVNALNIANCTVMMLAGNYGHVDIMEYLLTKGAKVETKSSDNDLSITRPINSGHIDVVKFYIRHGVDLNATGLFNESALHAAVDSPAITNQKEILELLKKYNGLKNINLPNNDGHTPLMSSVLKYDTEIFEWLLDAGADASIKNKKGEDVFSILKSRHKQDMLAILGNKLEAQLINKTDSQAPILRELLNKIQSIVISPKAIDNLPNMDKDKIVYFKEQRERLAILTEKGFSLLQLSTVDFLQLKLIIENIYNLDNILKVVTLKQIFKIDHTPPALPNNFKLDLPLPGIDSGTGGGGDPDDFLFETSHRYNKVTYKSTTEYEVSWTRLDAEKDIQHYDALASKQQQQKRYLYRWVELEANDTNPSPLIQRINPQPMRLIDNLSLNLHNKLVMWKSPDNDDFSDQHEVKVSDDNKNEEIEKDDKIKKVYYSPDTKQFIYEKYDKEFPFDALMEKHIWALFEVPYYQEQCKNETLTKNGYSFEKLRAIKGMTETKLSILTNVLNPMLALSKLMSIEELILVNDERLHFLLENFDKCVTSALKFVDIREIVGFNDKPKLTSNLSPKSQHKIFDLVMSTPDESAKLSELTNKH